MNNLTHFQDKWRISSAKQAFTIFFLVITTTFYSSLWAVDCEPMSMTLNTQAEVDSFQDTYGPCDRVLTLYVEGTDISNLAGLSELTGIGSSLYIQNNTNLTSIDGLSAVTDVGGSLVIRDNALLRDLNGLSSVTSLGSGVIISSAYQTNEIYDEVFGVFYLDTVPFGECNNNAMPSLKINETDPFWVANPGLTETPANATGCGSDNAAIVDGESEVTALGGLVDTAVVSFAVRYQGSGVFWLLEADWPWNTATVTEDSKIFMGALIANDADVPSLIFEGKFE